MAREDDINKFLDQVENTYLPDIRNALIEKEVSVPATIKVSDIPKLINNIEVPLKTGTLRINQTVNYLSGYNYTSPDYITFTHTVYGPKTGYQNTEPIIGTKTIDIELEEGTYTFYKQINNEKAGSGAYTTNFTSNSEEITIKAGEVTTVNLVYTRASGNYSYIANYRTESQVSSSTQNFTYVVYYENEEFTNRIQMFYRTQVMNVNSSTMSTYVNVGSRPIGTFNVTIDSYVHTGSFNWTTLNNYYRAVIDPTSASINSTTNQIFTVTRLAKNTSPGNPEEPSIESLTGQKTLELDQNAFLVSFDDIEFEVVENGSETLEVTEPDTIESIEWDEDLGCNIINGKPYYGDPKNYPDPLRVVFETNYSGSIEKSVLIPTTKDESEAKYE